MFKSFGLDGQITLLKGLIKFSMVAYTPGRLWLAREAIILGQPGLHRDWMRTLFKSNQANKHKPKQPNQKKKKKSSWVQFVLANTPKYKA